MGWRTYIPFVSASSKDNSAQSTNKSDLNMPDDDEKETETKDETIDSSDQSNSDTTPEAVPPEIDNKFTNLEGDIKDNRTELNKVSNTVSELEDSIEHLEERTEGLVSLYDEFFRDENPLQPDLNSETETLDADTDSDTDSDTDTEEQKTVSPTPESKTDSSSDETKTTESKVETESSKKISSVEVMLESIPEDKSEVLTNLLLHLITSGGKKGAKESIELYHTYEYISESARETLLEKIPKQNHDTEYQKLTAKEHQISISYLNKLYGDR